VADVDGFEELSNLVIAKCLFVGERTVEVRVKRSSRSWPSKRTPPPTAGYSLSLAFLRSPVHPSTA
jgi:hypothetical protein